VQGQVAEVADAGVIIAAKITKRDPPMDPDRDLLMKAQKVRVKLLVENQVQNKDHEYFEAGADVAVMDEEAGTEEDGATMDAEVHPVAWQVST
jgi:hypothetical protein